MLVSNYGHLNVSLPFLTVLNTPFQRTKIFVGSLGNGARPEELRRLFENYGVVTECDIVNRCGFVHMETEEQASDAIQNLNHSSFNGQTISVEFGRQKERSGGSGGPMRSSSGPSRGGGGGFSGRGSFRPSGPYDRMGAGRDDFTRRRMDDGGGGGDRRTSYSRSGGGYSGEDRRGFALPEDDQVFQRRSSGGGPNRGYGNGSSFEGGSNNNHYGRERRSYNDNYQAPSSSRFDEPNRSMAMNSGGRGGGDGYSQQRP